MSPQQLRSRADARFRRRHDRRLASAAVLARVTTFAIAGLDPRPRHRRGRRPRRPADLHDRRARRPRRPRGARARPRGDPQLGLRVPARRITVNLAPAHLRKAGPGFDLAIAVGVLAASGQIAARALERLAVFGELSLGGELRPGRGVARRRRGRRARGARRARRPARARAPRRRWSTGSRSSAAGTLAEVADVLRGGERAAGARAGGSRRSRRRRAATPDLADVRGHAGADRARWRSPPPAATTCCSAGPPGTGKTMLARRLPSILPPLTRAEALEVTRIHSVAGPAPTAAGLVERAPVPRAAPHDLGRRASSAAARRRRPARRRLAHHGVLFLDELSEFPRPALEALRQPLEDGRVAIVRGQRRRDLPDALHARRGHEPVPVRLRAATPRCRCTEADLARHRRRLSGPLLDRIDLAASTSQRPAAARARRAGATTSAAVRERVVAARERQARAAARHRRRAATRRWRRARCARTSRRDGRRRSDAAASAYDRGRAQRARARPGAARRAHDRRPRRAPSASTREHVHRGARAAATSRTLDGEAVA